MFAAAMLTEEQHCVQLVRIEVPSVHYLEMRSICWHSIHLLCSAQTLVILTVLLQRKEKLVNFHHSIGKNILHVNNFLLLLETAGFEPEIL
jgi:hypothetical protein